jgi:hypothetical protein
MLLLPIPALYTPILAEADGTLFPLVWPTSNGLDA